jgi:3-oxoacyl-[acyl-carrier protein] reductase
MLDNKIAFITGSTRGIGWAIAELFAKNGALVILNGHSDSGLLQKRLNELKAISTKNHDALLCDVGNLNQVTECYQKIFAKYKRLDILVNNAGILEDSLIGTITSDMVQKIYTVNVVGYINNIQYASRLMTRKKSGSIINIASIIGRFGNAGQLVYGSSKAAVIGMTYSAAKELAPLNINVNAIAPGFIDTDMVKKVPKDKYDNIMSSIKMGRIGTPKDVANAALFFASDLASYVTGQVLGVDGGMLI